MWYANISVRPRYISRVLDDPEACCVNNPDWYHTWNFPFDVSVNDCYDCSTSVEHAYRMTAISCSWWPFADWNFSQNLIFLVKWSIQFSMLVAKLSRTFFGVNIQYAVNREIHDRWQKYNGTVALPCTCCSKSLMRAVKQFEGGSYHLLRVWLRRCCSFVRSSRGIRLKCAVLLTSSSDTLCEAFIGSPWLPIAKLPFTVVAARQKHEIIGFWNLLWNWIIG